MDLKNKLQYAVVKRKIKTYNMNQEFNWLLKKMYKRLYAILTCKKLTFEDSFIQNVSLKSYSISVCYF